MNKIYDYLSMGLFGGGGETMLRRMMHEMDVDKRKRAKADFGITRIYNLEGCQRLGIEPVYQDIEIKNGYLYCYRILNDYAVKVFTLEGKLLFEAQEIEYMKEGMFLVGNLVPDDKDKILYALYNQDRKVS